MRYDKLVRDGIPDIIRADGREPKTKIVNHDEWLARLKEKLGEEVEEFLESHEPGELADIMEVVHTLAHALGKTPEHIAELQEAKRKTRGGFMQRIILEEA